MRVLVGEVEEIVKFPAWACQRTKLRRTISEKVEIDCSQLLLCLKCEKVYETLISWCKLSSQMTVYDPISWLHVKKDRSKAKSEVLVTFQSYCSNRRKHGIIPKSTNSQPVLETAANVNWSPLVINWQLRKRNGAPVSSWVHQYVVAMSKDIFNR